MAIAWFVAAVATTRGNGLKEASPDKGIAHRHGLLLVVPTAATEQSHHFAPREDALNALRTSTAQPCYVARDETLKLRGLHGENRVRVGACCVNTGNIAAVARARTDPWGRWQHRWCMRSGW